MAKTIDINRKKYRISKRRYKELFYFCLQYDEWREELKSNTDTVRSIEITDTPHGSGIGNPTQDLAIRREALLRKCELVEQTAIEVDAEIYQHLIKAVTRDLSFTYLRTVLEMPYGKNKYYDRRRKFFWLLDQKNI